MEKLEQEMRKVEQLMWKAGQMRSESVRRLELANTLQRIGEGQVQRLRQEIVARGRRSEAARRGHHT